MLFWLRRSTYKRVVLWAKFAAVSSILHLVILVWFFFVHKDRSSKLSFIVSPDLFNRNIQFTIASPAKPTLVKTQVSAKPAIKKKNTPQKKQAPKKKQTTIQKSAKSTTSTSSSTKSKNIKKTTPAKPAPKPIVQKKELPPKEAPLEKKVETPPALAPAPVENKPATQELAENNYEFEVCKIGVKEKGLLEEFKLLHEEIVSRWAPPPGIDAACACTLTVLVDWKGNIRTVTINESSGVLMYDTSAKKVLHELAMPKWAWGKELTITFNQ